MVVGCWLLVIGCSRLATAQQIAIEPTIEADLFIENVGDRVVIKADLVDGFVYRFPFSVSTNSKLLHLTGLTAESVCNCVQVKFMASDLSRSSPASGEIFLRPKSGKLVEGIRIRGFAEGSQKKFKIDEDNIAFLMELNITIKNPLVLSDHHILVEDGKFKKDSIAIDLIDGISVKEISGSCSDPNIRVQWNANDKLLVVDSSGSLTEGRIYLDFEIEAQGVKGRVAREVSYGERIKTRTVPSLLQFNGDSEAPQQKCILISPDFLRVDSSSVDVRLITPDGAELPNSVVKAELRKEKSDKPIKAVLIITVVDKEALRDFQTWSIRLVNRNNFESFVDIHCKWL